MPLIIGKKIAGAQGEDWVEQKKEKVGECERSKNINGGRLERGPATNVRLWLFLASPNRGGRGGKSHGTL